VKRGRHAGRRPSPQPPYAFMPDHDATPVDALRNLGPVSAAWLREVGIPTRGDLERAGAALAYRVVRDRHPTAGLNLLYALHGALTGERWDRLAEGTRQRLRAEADEAAGIPPTPGQ
jgi:DNA transformation protein and related proteins